METTTNNSLEVLAKAIKKEIDSIEAKISTRKAEIETAYKAIVDKATAERDEALKEFNVEQDTKERLQASYDSLTGAKPKPATTAKPKKGKVDTDKKELKPLEIPTEYPTSGYRGKVAYILSKSDKPLSRDEITLAIAKLDKATDTKKILAGVNGFLSESKDYKGIVGEKNEGRKIYYRLGE